VHLLSIHIERAPSFIVNGGDRHCSLYKEVFLESARRRQVDVEFYQRNSVGQSGGVQIEVLREVYLFFISEGL
jgi:hypothetical protein